MKRLAVILIVATLTALATTAYAFFADSVDQETRARADRPDRWLTLETRGSDPAGDATCDPGGYADRRGEPGTAAASGEDAAVTVNLGRHGNTSDRVVRCVLTLHAAPTFGEGFAALDVEASHGPGPLAGVAITDPGAGGASPSASMAAGDVRALALTVDTTGLAAGALGTAEVRLRIGFPDGSSMSYLVPVSACRGAFADHGPC